MALETLHHDQLIWTNIVRPTPADIAQLGQQHPNFHPLELEDCLSRIERPKIDDHEDYLFLVMHFPVWDPERRISIPGEVDFFIGPGYLVTVHEGELKPLVNFFELCKSSEEARAQFFTSPGKLLHTVIDRLVDYVFPILYKVDANIRSIEETMFDENMQRTIQDISIVRRDIVALRRIIRPQVPIVFVDALASHRINEVIRVLTVISLVLLPLEVIVGFMGMNVLLPLQDFRYAWLVIIGVMVALVAMLLGYFKYKKWL
jgi:magnesium transporter